MPVVINEFEVLPAAEPPPAPEPRPEPARKPELEKAELEKAMTCWRERLERVRAH